MGSHETEQQFKEWRDALRAVPSRLLGPIQRRADGSDIAQDAVLQLWLQDASPETVSRAYLATVAHGHACKIRRFHNRACRAVDREVVLTEEPMTTVTPETVIQDREELAWMSLQLTKLPQDQQRVIHWRLFRKMSFAEIAQELEINERACRYKYDTAIEDLRRLMEPDENRLAESNGTN